MNEKVDPTLVPERIWLLLHEGDEGSHVWCDQPDPSGSGEHEAVAYVRADLVTRTRTRTRREWQAVKVNRRKSALWAEDET